MADPVWPTPPWYLGWLVSAGRAMERGLGFLVEHGHRQLGWIVGLLTLVLAAWLWFGEGRRSLRWLGIIALGGVAVQGLLGGLRVVLIAREVAVVHAVVAQAFFAFMVALALFTSRGWQRRDPPVESTGAARLRRLALVTTSFVFLQLVLGAMLRHLGVGLVAHLVVAPVIVVHVGLLAKRVYVEHADKPRLRRPVELLALLVVGQLMLGAGAWATSSGFGADALSVPTAGHALSATAHVALGALILATCVVLTLRCYRDLTPIPESRSRAAGEPVRSPRAVPLTRAPSVSSLERRELLAEGGTA